VSGSGEETPRLREGDTFKVQSGVGTSQAEHYRVVKAPSASAAAPHAMLV
jgi:hypothetical protein